MHKDEAKSGRSVVNRSGYIAAMAAAISGKCDLIMVTALDRLGRNARELNAITLPPGRPCAMTSPGLRLHPRRHNRRISSGDSGSRWAERGWSDEEWLERYERREQTPRPYLVIRIAPPSAAVVVTGESLPGGRPRQ